MTRPKEALVDLRCRSCDGEVQMTRKTYWSVVDGQGVPEQVQTDQPDVWNVYCENDCMIAEDLEADLDEIVPLLTRIMVDAEPLSPRTGRALREVT